MNPPEYRAVSMAVVQGRLFRVGQRPPKIMFKDRWGSMIDLSKATKVVSISEMHRPEWSEPAISFMMVFPGDIGDRVLTAYHKGLLR